MVDLKRVNDIKWIRMVSIKVFAQRYGGAVRINHDTTNNTYMETGNNGDEDKDGDGDDSNDGGGDDVETGGSCHQSSSSLSSP